MVKEKKQPLQKVAHLNEEELLAEEEKNILLSLEYSKKI
jgi:hypothetical protein